jgi:heme a synthase
MSAGRSLALATLGLTLVVVVVGAYVRLSDAGLGCPDWPLCYGRALPGAIADGDALARAWKEMGHRYLAGALGLLILAMAVHAWRTRTAPWLATTLLALVVFQATLGMWTVTLLLKPAIVTAHLLGGMAILAIVVWLVLLQFAISTNLRELRVPAAAALAVLTVQIALGGWVSANYAGLACPDLPLCRGALVPPLDDALVAIHWTHRMFALAVVAVLSWASVKTFRHSKALALLIAALLLAQFLLGVANVWFALPLALAAAHNAGAALLLAALVVLNFLAFRKSSRINPGL